MIGSIISHYKILEKLGEGGMGIVYKAQDTKLDRLVALKFLPQALTADASERERFYHEARAASQLLHPNVTAIFEINESDGQIYLAMEYVDGETLRKYIQREEILSIGKALDIAIQICTGISAAHEKGIVHRDIKSENILLTAKGEVKITDFGLAKLKGASKLTKTGSTLGTAAYMSPEQARGEDIDARSDIFSCGVVLYELFTGKLPFRGEHQAAILYSLVNEEPLPLARFNENISAELQRIISKALTKDKDDRYQHADEMLADFKRERKGMEYAKTGAIIQQHATSVKENARPSGSRTTIGRKKNMKLIIGGVVFLLLAAAMYFYFGKPSGNHSSTGSALNKIAVLPFENIGPSDKEYFADGLTDEIRTKLSGLSGLAVIARASSMQYKKTAKPVSDIGNELGVGYLLQGTIRWEQSDSSQHGAVHLLVNPTLVKITDGTQVWSQSFEGTLSSVFQMQSDIAQQVARALAVVLNPAERKTIESKPTDNAEAYDYFLRGQQSMVTGVPGKAKQAVSMFQKATELDPKFSAAYAYLSRAYTFLLFQGQGSDSLLALAKKSVDKVLELAPNSYISNWAQGYYYYYGYRNYDRALTFFTAALDLQPNNPEVIAAIAYVKRRQGKFLESLDLLAKTCDLDPKFWDNWSELAYLEMIMRRYGSADEHFKRAFVVLGKGSTPVAAFHSLAVFSTNGDVKAAHEVFERESDETKSWTYKERSFQFHITEDSLEAAKNDLTRDVLTQPDANPVGYYMDWGLLFDKLSQHSRAITYYDSARVLAEQALKIYPTNWTVHAALGGILAHLGQTKKAIEEGKKVVELMPMERDALEGGPDALYTFAQICALAGEPDVAMENIEKVLSIPSQYTAYFVQLDPEFASLKSLPRFQKLMEKYKSAIGIR